MLKKLNAMNFKSEIANGVALVDFYADWCGPCKMLAPIIEQVANEVSDVTVGKVNVDESGELAAEFGISSIPTMIIFKDGVESRRIIGFKPKDAIIAELTK